MEHKDSHCKLNQACREVLNGSEKAAAISKHL